MVIISGVPIFRIFTVLFQFYSMLASPSSLTLVVRVMFFELCVHDWQAPVRRAMLSGDSSCSKILQASLNIFNCLNNLH